MRTMLPDDASAWHVRVCKTETTFEQYLRPRLSRSSFSVGGVTEWSTSRSEAGRKQPKYVAKNCALSRSGGNGPPPFFRMHGCCLEPREGLFEKFFPRYESRAALVDHRIRLSCKKLSFCCRHFLLVVRSFRLHCVFQFSVRFWFSVFYFSRFWFLVNYFYFIILLFYLYVRISFVSVWRLR